MIATRQDQLSSPFRPLWPSSLARKNSPVVQASALCLPDLSAMNVVVESQPNCLVTLRVELPSDQVSKEWSNIARTFQRKARIPGYRPGKAPQGLVESRFAKDIKEELTSKLLRESLNEAIRENNLRVLSISEVENVEIAEDRTMSYRVDDRHRARIRIAGLLDDLR